MEMNAITSPGSKSIDPWNFFPDPSCGENIHNGAYVWERDFITRKQLRELIVFEEEGYNEIQILKCLKEGPMMATSTTKKKPDPIADSNYSKKFEIWYYHGTAEKEDMIAGGCDCGEEEDPYVHAMVTIVNNHVIRASLNPLVTGDYPYDVLPWRKKSGHWTGIGVARQCREGQKIVVGGTRNLMDNAGMAAGPMLVFKQGVITPADGVAGIGPRKVFYIAEDSGIEDATKAIGVIKVPMIVDELMAIIEYGKKVAEDSSGIQLLMQGQQGSAPDTVGGMIILNNNANSVLRRLAKLFDDRITEPHIRRYYKWLLLNTDDDTMKGDFMIDARGSSALLERDIQNQEMPVLLQLSKDPTYGIDPKKTIDEYLKSRRFAPKNFQYDDEEWKQTVEQLSSPPPDSAVEVATLRAQTEEIKEQNKQALEQLKLDHDGVQNDRDREVKLVIETMHQDINSIVQNLKERGMDNRSLEEAKTKLTDTLMKLDVQKQLSGTEALTPAVEPRGRAPDGESFQK